MVFLFCFYSSPTKFPASSVRLRIAGALGYVVDGCSGVYFVWRHYPMLFINLSLTASYKAPLPVMDCTTPGKNTRQEHIHTYIHLHTYVCMHRHHRVHQDFLGIGPSLSLPIYDFAFTKGVLALQDFEYFEFSDTSNPIECLKIRVGFLFCLPRSLDPTTHIVC